MCAGQERIPMHRQLQLQLEQAIIRDYRPEDAEALARAANDRLIWRNLLDGFPHPYTLQDAREFLRTKGSGRRAQGGGSFAIEVSGELAGGIGFRPGEDVYRRRVEIGFWLDRRFWNQGIATAAVRGFTNWLLAADPELLRVQAQVFHWNVASMRVLAKAGFLFEGRLRRAAVKDGRVVDILMFARTR